jgi:predicted nucleic acid-binding protein
MNEHVMLDSGPLGQLANPKAKPEILAWHDSMLAAGRVLIVPEVIDYEIRRSLLHHQFHRSLQLLDTYKHTLEYQPITTRAMLRAAQLWADARRRGMPTADPKELDCDVILAAMALEAGAIVATENVGHISRYVTAVHWRQITP